MRKILIFNLLFLILTSFVFAEMSSDHYFIARDSINSFGNENSSSSNYILSDTGGEISSGYGSSASYVLHAGFRQFEEYKMELNCQNKNINLVPIRLNGKSSLHKNYIDCNVKTNNPTGYTLQWASQTDELIQKENPTYKVEKISNNTTADWPAVLTNGTGWGGHLGTESENFDAGKWGNSNDYSNGGGQWVAFSEDQEFEVINRGDATDNSGDDERIYFGLEVDDNTTLPPGEYETEISLTLLPAF